MPIRVALRFINHLLEGESWAPERLSAYSGQTAHLVLGTLVFPLEISAEGYFKPSPPVAEPSVTLTLPADALLRAITDRAALFSAARISGSAELAEILGFVFRHLRWDIEDDLSPLFGDIAARRLVQGGKRLFSWHQEQAVRLAQNLAEYFTEEVPAIARSQDISMTRHEIETLQTQLGQLERRIVSLEKDRLA